MELPLLKKYKVTQSTIIRTKSLPFINKTNSNIGIKRQLKIHIINEVSTLNFVGFKNSSSLFINLVKYSIS